MNTLRSSFAGSAAYKASFSPRQALMLLVLSIAVSIGGIAPGRAASRVALVIGNTNYANAPALATPANDASDVAAALSRVGFAVTLQIDATAKDLKNAFKAFAAKSAKAELAIVYFAGYGVGAGPSGYLIPIDATRAGNADAAVEWPSVSTAIASLARAPGLGVIILDAQREHPFEIPTEKAIAAAAGKAPNVLLFFASAPGRSMVEASGRNSHLATALLKFIPQPELDLNFLLRNVRDDVRAATSQQQTPFMYGQLSTKKIYLNPRTIDRATTRAPDPADPNQITSCDRLAAAADDPSRNAAVKGVSISGINAATAIAACREAAAQYPGIDRFHYQLGRAHYAGKDYPAAIESYRRATELNNVPALFALAAMYEDGIGVTKDPGRARFLLELAANRDFAPAISRLGLQQERGIDSPANAENAFGLYRRAADIGDLQAWNKMGQLTEKGLGTDKDLSRARQFYETGAGKGDAEAMVNLARCYANAIGGPQDIPGAKKWLAKAAAAGNDEATRILASIAKAKRN
jgi:uncharacterized caspase-like protein